MFNGKEAPLAGSDGLQSIRLACHYFLTKNAS